MRLGLKTLWAIAARLAPTVLLAFSLQALTVSAARAVPAFAVQTGQACQACHVGGFGPQLTPFGRNFKLHGYTSRAGGFTLPISAMLEDSYVNTRKDQSPPPAPGYGGNNNFTLDQISLFVAGGLGDHLGAFIQTTYDGIAKAFTWDNVDVRAVTTTTIAGKDTVLGLSVNNNPTVQDAFNTVPAWSFPYAASGLSPSPAASPLIGNLAQTSLGVTAYAWIDNQFYIEFGGYESPTQRLLTQLGAAPSMSIQGFAPYGRVAWQKTLPNNSNMEIGAFVLDAGINPGLDTSTGMRDHYTDLGLDASYQAFRDDKSVFTVNARYTHEHQSLHASQALEQAANVGQTLEDLRFDASYYWHDRVGLTVGAFDTWGSSDDILYGGNVVPRPDSSGLLFQIDGTPFGGDGDKNPLGKRFNIRVGAQYTDYLSYNGLGRGASDNNTFRVFTWIAY